MSIQERREEQPSKEEEVEYEEEQQWFDVKGSEVIYFNEI